MIFSSYVSVYQRVTPIGLILESQFLCWKGYGSHMDQLVGGLEHDFFDFPYIRNNSPNWRTHIFRWVGIPPTSQFFGVPKIWVPKPHFAWFSHDQKLGWNHVSIILAIRHDYQQIEKKNRWCKYSCLYNVNNIEKVSGLSCCVFFVTSQCSCEAFFLRGNILGDGQPGIPPIGP